MRESKSLTDIRNSVLSNTGNKQAAVTSDALAPLLQGLMEGQGWHDRRGEVLALDQEIALLEGRSRQAAADYDTAPTAANRDVLMAAWMDEIAALSAERDAAQAQQRHFETKAEQAAKTQLQAKNSQGWGEWLMGSLKSWVSATPEQAAQEQAQYYAELFTKKQTRIDQLQSELMRLKAEAQTALPPLMELGTELGIPHQGEQTAAEQEVIEEVISPLSRRLLATENPIVILPQQYCPPTGSCDLSNLRDGAGGFVLQGEAAGDYSGFSVSSAGDINGDGVGDLVVGAYGADLNNNRTDAGKSYVVFGSRNDTVWGNGTWDLSTLIDGQRGFVLQGEEGEWSGYSVSAAGDVNADGVDDLVIGAIHLGGGKSYVVFGSRNSTDWSNGTLDLGTLMDGRRGFVLQGEILTASGYSVSAAGDVNGDDVADIVVGAYGVSLSGRSGGNSYVVFGSRNNTNWGNGTLGLRTLVDGRRGFVLQGEAEGDQSGWSVSSAGDINGDGVSDLVVGAPRADSNNNRTDAGKSYVVFGSRNNTAWGNGTLDLSSLRDGVRGFVLQGEAATIAVDGYSEYSGSSVNGAGDVNGDGIGDLLIGANQASPSGRARAGKSYVVFGSRNNTAWGNGTLDLSSLRDGMHGFVLQGEAVFDFSGISVSAAGDINGDGVADLVVGAYLASPSGRSYAGKSYVVFGSRNNTAWGNGTLELSTIRNGVRGFALQGEAAYDESGVSVSAGDMNGDGVVDLVVGAYYASSNNNRTYAGKSYVVFGASFPLQWANELTVYNGLATRLSSENLNVTYSAPVQLNVTAVSNGRFEYVANPGQAITLFNQSAVWDGQIQFVHNGGSVAPSYSLQVVSASRLASKFPSQNATITFYEFYTTNKLTIHQGETLRINRTFLDAYSNYTTEQVIFTVSSLQHGQFFLEPLNNSVVQFSQSHILTGQVLFAHDDSRTAPSYNVEITDPGNTLLPANPSAVTFYRRPVWLSNQLTLTQGETVVLGATQVNITADVPGNQVLFTINSLQHGQFRLIPSNSSIANFTQQQLLAGQVSFCHDNTGIAPSYQLRLSDGYFTLAPEPAGITFTALPPVLTNNNLTVYQGRNHTLSFADLRATDPDLFFDTSQLQFIVSDVQHGQFRLPESTSAVAQFTQAYISDGQVVFMHDGSATAPSYRVTVSNTYQNTTAVPATISFDKRPSVINNRLSLETGESTVLALTNLQAVDDRTPSGELLFTLSQVTHGYFSELQNPSVAITQFSQQRVRDSEIQFQHDGSHNAPSFSVKVTDSSGLESSQSSAQINFKDTRAPSGIDLQKLYASVSSIGGIAVAIAGYLWWRRKTTAHRRSFELANNLRKAANLEYHDFMRFDGDVFKSKVENLLSHVDSLQKGFYKSLTPEQRKSFAVCIAEILEERHLLKPSGYGMGIYGWMLAFSVGWSQQLDFKKFEAQLTEIAQQAVTAWQAEENSTTRWQYFSPTCKDKVNAFCCARPSRAGMFAHDKVRLSRSEGVSLTDLKDSKHQVIDMSSSSQKDVLAQTTGTTSSPRFFDRGASSQELASLRQEVTDQFKQVAEGISSNFKTVNERLDRLESQPLLTGPGSSSL